MSTKADIQSSINTIDDGGLNTASEVRTVFGNMLSNAYGTVVTDTQATTNVLTADNATDKQYSVSILKQGREVLISGFIKNNTASMIAGEVFFTINSGEYTQDANIITIYGNLQSTGNNVRLALGASTLTLIDTIGANATVYFQTKYYTNS